MVFGARKGRDNKINRNGKDVEVGRSEGWKEEESGKGRNMKGRNMKLDGKKQKLLGMKRTKRKRWGEKGERGREWVE